MTTSPTNPGYRDFPPEVRDAVLSLVTHPLPLGREDFEDLARGRLGRLCGPLSAKPEPQIYQLALLAAVEGRGF